MHSSVANDASSAGASPGCRTTRRRRSWFMTHHFDVVTVGVEHEGAVVVGVVVRARTGRAVIAPAGCECRGVERIDQRTLADAERDVHRRLVGYALSDPEVRFGRRTEAGDIVAAGHRGRKLQQQPVADGLERHAIEGFGPLDIADLDSSVIDHDAPRRNCRSSTTCLTVLWPRGPRP